MFEGIKVKNKGNLWAVAPGQCVRPLITGGRSSQMWFWTIAHSPYSPDLHHLTSICFQNWNPTHVVAIFSVMMRSCMQLRSTWRLERWPSSTKGHRSLNIRGPNALTLKRSMLKNITRTIFFLRRFLVGLFDVPNTCSFQPQLQRFISYCSLMLTSTQCRETVKAIIWRLVTLDGSCELQ